MATRTIERPVVGTRARVVEEARPAERVKGATIFGLTRISIGFVFLWAFLDKAFALGFATGRAEDGTIDFFAQGSAWLNGGSPTAGVLAYATKGPLAGFFQSLAGQTWIDWALLDLLLKVPTMMLSMSL